MSTATADQDTQSSQGGAAGAAAGARDFANQYVGKARDFAKARPAATAALAGVVGLAILNTLRGKG